MLYAGTAEDQLLLSICNCKALPLVGIRRWVNTCFFFEFHQECADNELKISWDFDMV
jgi:hypothetical protein